jgi:vesicle coat complex subunit
MNEADPGSLERLVAEDPDALDEQSDRIHRRLDSDDANARMDAARTFRVAAEHDPELVAPHLETLLVLLDDPNGSLRLSGAIAIAELAERDPDRLAEFVPELTALLETERAPAIRMAALRGLTHIGERFPERVSVADGSVAALVDGAGAQLKTAALSVFSSAVLADPRRFPETIAAYEHALDDGSARVRRCAVSAIASVAAADPAALDSPERVLERIEEIEERIAAQPWTHDSQVLQAASTLRDLLKPERS